MQVTGFDHVVLAVEDVERSLACYTGVPRFPPTRVEDARPGRPGGPGRPGRPGGPGGPGRPGGPGSVADRNVDHICLVVEPMDLVAWAAGAGQEIIDGPGPRFGARGVATSIYIRDPDANT